MRGIEFRMANLGRSLRFNTHWSAHHFPPSPVEGIKKEQAQKYRQFLPPGLPKTWSSTNLNPENLTLRARKRGYRSRYPPTRDQRGVRSAPQKRIRVTKNRGKLENGNFKKLKIGSRRRLEGRGLSAALGTRVLSCLETRVPVGWLQSVGSFKL